MATSTDLFDSTIHLEVIMRTYAKKKSGMNATARNLAIDLGMALVAVLVYSQEVTGTTLHEWLAVGLLTTVLVHIALHWRWVVNVGQRIFGKVARQSRINFWVNLAFLLAVMLTAASGMAISESFLPALGLPSGGGGLWEDVHEAAANLTLLLGVAHVALHAKWLLTNGRRYLLDPLLARLAVPSLRAERS